VFVVPFLVWDPGAFLSQQLATVTFHTDVWGANLPALLQQYTDVTPWLPLFFAAEILGTVVVFGLFLRARFRTLGAATFAGCAVILVALLFARWTTQPYYAYLGGVAAMALALVDRDAREIATP
jgi:urea transporter